MRGHKQYPFERSREYLFDTVPEGAGVSGCCSPEAGTVGVDYGDELTAQSSTCYRSCPDGPTTQICPVGSLKNNALETATVLSNKGCPTGTQIRASAGAGCRRSQSTNQHNRPKEFTKPLRVNARWKVLSFSLEALQRKYLHNAKIESSANGFQFFFILPTYVQVLLREFDI